MPRTVLTSNQSMAFSGDPFPEVRVCFGHQSVGADIVNALSDLSGQRLEIVETDDPEAYGNSTFGHFKVGCNGDPLSKCRAFAEVIASGVGDYVDVALFKFCYVDVTSDTDIEALFRAYREMMGSLVEQYPQATFLHVTVPLRQVTQGLRGWLGEMSGRPIRERKDQERRHAFNQLLRRAYGDSGCLFDLAEMEATFPDGTPAFFTHQGHRIPNLVADYTDDGSHLNQRAAARAAGRLLECLKARTRREK
jgi:hypothetical protein